MSTTQTTLLEQLAAAHSYLALTKKQLDYYHVMSYCAKRQLHESRSEVTMRVSAEEHNELKTKFKNVSKKLREMVLRNRRSSE